MEKTDTDYREELEKFRLKFSRCASGWVTPLWYNINETTNRDL